MGYYTNFKVSLDLQDGKPDASQLARDFTGNSRGKLFESAKTLIESGLLKPTTNSIGDVCKALINESPYVTYENLGWVEGDSGAQFELEAVKWYDWEEELCNLTSKFPNLVVTVEGEGEESGDLWHAKVYRGKCLKKMAEIVLPPITLEEIK